MQINVTSTPDETTDLIFMNKLAEYCQQKSIQLSFIQYSDKVVTVFEAPEERLQELKQYLEAKQSEQESSER